MVMDQKMLGEVARKESKTRESLQETGRPFETHAKLIASEEPELAIYFTCRFKS